MTQQSLWGEPDDIEPFPAWMKPQNNNTNQLNSKGKSKSLMESIEDAMKKPAIPIDHNTFNLNDVHIQLNRE
jgi:hypothetical protein